jgi:hypothetical protein
MDRIAASSSVENGFTRITLAGLGLGVALAISWGFVVPAHAGPFLEAPPTVAEGGDGYPESRFGYAPARVDAGVSSNYAARAVRDMDEEDIDIPRDVSRWNGVARRPAGLEFSEETRPSKPNPVLQEPETRRPRGAVITMPGSPIGNPMLRKGLQEVALIASDLGYFPKTLFVVRDVPVRLYVTGSSKNTLCLMMDSFQIRKQVRSQRIEEIQFTPGAPGRYRFYCPVNGMEGTLVVKELSSGPVTEGVSVPKNQTTANTAGD